MIPKEDIKMSLLCNTLECGWADVNALVEDINKVENTKFMIKGKEDFLFPFENEGKIADMLFERIEDNSGDPAGAKNINKLFYELYCLIMERINQIYDLTLEECKDYEIYVNCLDSHLYLLEDDFNETLTETEESIKAEIKAIVEPFN